MPKYGLSLIGIFRYMDRIISVFSRIWTEIRKYGSEKASISVFFTQWSPRKGVLVFSKVGD